MRPTRGVPERQGEGRRRGAAGWGWKASRRRRSSPAEAGPGSQRGAGQKPGRSRGVHGAPRFLSEGSRERSAQKPAGALPWPLALRSRKPGFFWKDGHGRQASQRASRPHVQARKGGLAPGPRSALTCAPARGTAGIGAAPLASKEPQVLSCPERTHRGPHDLLRTLWVRRRTHRSCSSGQHLRPLGVWTI